MGGLYWRLYDDIGDLNLAYGTHEIVFHLGYEPKRVLIHVNNEYGLPVCQGDINYVSATIIDDGFILHAQIKTNEAYVLWLTTSLGGQNILTTDNHGTDLGEPTIFEPFSD